MSDRERSPSELLRQRIIGDTGEQIAKAGTAMFDLFTGGAEAVLDNLAEDYEAKKRGEVGAVMRARYRCSGCGGVHNEGNGCDAELVTHAPPPVISAADTDRAPAPSFPVARIALESPRLLVCADCVKEDEEARFSRFGIPISECERCHVEQPANARAFRVWK